MATIASLTESFWDNDVMIWFISKGIKEGYPEEVLICLDSDKRKHINEYLQKTFDQPIRSYNKNNSANLIEELTRLNGKADAKQIIADISRKLNLSQSQATALYKYIIQLVKYTVSGY